MGRQSKVPYPQEAGKGKAVYSGFPMLRPTPPKGLSFRRTVDIELLHIENLVKLGALFSQRAFDAQVLSF